MLRRPGVKMHSQRTEHAQFVPGNDQLQSVGSAIFEVDLAAESVNLFILLERGDVNARDRFDPIDIRIGVRRIFAALESNQGNRKDEDARVIRNGIHLGILRPHFLVVLRIHELNAAPPILVHRLEEADDEIGNIGRNARFGGCFEAHELLFFRCG